VQWLLSEGRACAQPIDVVRARLIATARARVQCGRGHKSRAEARAIKLELELKKLFGTVYREPEEHSSMKRSMISIHAKIPQGKA
jgi:hypothetical protein